MSIFLCRAVVTKAVLEQAQAKTEMQSESEMFEAKCAELSRQGRRQRIVPPDRPLHLGLGPHRRPHDPPQP